MYVHLLLQEESLEDWLETWLRQAEGETEYLPRRWFDHNALPLAYYIPPASEDQRRARRPQPPKLLDSERD